MPTMPRGRALCAALGLALLATGCSRAVAPPPSASAPRSFVTTGPGWTAEGIEDLPAANTCHMHTSADGHDLPDPACTPGAADNRVTQDNLRDTICRTGGYTGSVRPPVDVSEPAKRALLRAYGLNPADASKYELDHLVELSDGGSSDGRNLWPELNVLRDAKVDPYTKNDKDAVEREVHDAVCARRVTLDAARQAMATDWTKAIAVLGI